MSARPLGSLTLAALLAAAACGTSAVGVQTCRQIEDARCQRAPGCGIPLQPPYHTSGTDVSACVSFYADACLHGLANGVDPGTVAVQACLDAIETGPCTVVSEPQTALACAWLIPPASETIDAAATTTDATPAEDDAAAE